MGLLYAQVLLGIGLGELHEFALFAPLRHADLDLGTAQFAQPGCQEVFCTGHKLDEQAGGNVGGVVVEALDEDANQVAQVFGACLGDLNALEGEVLSSNQSTAAHHEDLDDCVVRLGVLGDGDNVFVVILNADDLLLVDDALGGFYAVAVDGGELEVEAAGGVVHAGLQLVDHFFGVAFEEIDELSDAFAIVGAALGIDTRTAAQFKMIVEAGAFVVAGDGAVTVEIGEDFADRFERAAHGPAAGKGAEVAGTVALDLAHALHFGEVILPVDLDIGVPLVILEHDVVVGLVTLDQVVFEDQRFHLGSGDPPGDVPHLADHFVDAGRVFGGPLEVATHARAEDERFAHIEWLGVLVPHEIAAGFAG